MLSIVLLSLLFLSTAAGQTACFGGGGLRAGAVLHMYDSSLHVPPAELTRTVAAKTTHEVEVRTETWEEVGEACVRDMTVRWSRYEHDEDVFTPDSLRAAPVPNKCYRLLRHPGVDTTFTYCDGSAFQRPAEGLLRWGFGRVRYPELLLRVFKGICIDEDGRREAAQRMYRIFEADSLLEYSDISLNWEAPGDGGVVPVRLEYTESFGPKTSGVVPRMSIHYTIDMRVEIATAHLVELHARKSILGVGSMGGTSSIITSRAEEHLFLDWE